MAGNEWRTPDMIEKSLATVKPQDVNYSGAMINHDSNPWDVLGIESVAFA
jgi:hypothetical protein